MMMGALARLGKFAVLFVTGVVTVVGMVSGMALFHFWLFLRLPAHTSREMHEVRIQPGMGASSIAGLLESNNVVSDGQLFHLLCWLKKSGHKLRAGEYAFSSFSTPEQILDQITTGRAIIHRVTLPEGSSVYDVARIMEQSGLVSGKDILQLSSDREVVRNLLGIEVPSLEGYLFPETYHFQKMQSDKDMLKRMVQEFRRHFPDPWQQRAVEMGLSIQEVVIMASLVEKEAAVDAERPVIAAVFFNRLKVGMPLQSDPTAVYDLPGFSGPITTTHLKRQSPYNTYVNKGLPVGPICNPGAKSLKAVLYPDKVPYLYFVSNNDGTHRFSETLQEHHEAVNRFHEKRKEAAAQEKAAQQPQPEKPGKSQAQPN